jgi:hypothetical protein
MCFIILIECNWGEWLRGLNIELSIKIIHFLGFKVNPSDFPYSQHGISLCIFVFTILNVYTEFEMLIHS